MLPRGHHAVRASYPIAAQLRRITGGIGNSGATITARSMSSKNDKTYLHISPCGDWWSGSGKYLVVMKKALVE